MGEKSVYFPITPSGSRLGLAWASWKYSNRRTQTTKARGGNAKTTDWTAGLTEMAPDMIAIKPMIAKARNTKHRAKRNWKSA